MASMTSTSILVAALSTLTIAAAPNGQIPRPAGSPPGVVIDHIVTGPQVRSGGYSVLPVAGTDHAAVLATLSVPAED